MTLDELDSDRAEEEKEEEPHIFIKFPNPRHPESDGYNEDEEAQRFFDAIAEVKAILGPDITTLLGEAAWASLESDKLYGNNNPEAIRDFANTVLNGTGYRVELVETEEDD